MPNSNKNLFDNLAKGESEGRTRKRSVGLLQKRNNELGELASGKVEDKVHRWVDPARCKIRENHNRRYDLLNKRRCQDLPQSWSMRFCVFSIIFFLGPNLVKIWNTYLHINS